MHKIRATTPAKINLFLQVLDRRPDGYHTIETLYQAISLREELIIEKSSGPCKLDVIGAPQLKSDDNLVIRALRWMEDRVGCRIPVRIRLTKQIPIAAGLGGGSSNAAGMLLALRELFEFRVSDQDLRTGAEELGADITFFFTGGSAVGEGIGEIVTPVKMFSDYRIVLVNPGFPISTARVYREFSRNLTGNPLEGRLWSVLRESAKVWDILHNDLQPVSESLYPEILEIGKRLEDTGFKHVLMSGSGPTFFALVPRGESTPVNFAFPSEWIILEASPEPNGIVLD